MRPFPFSSLLPRSRTNAYALVLAVAVCAGLMPQTAHADTAFVIVNERYQNAQNLQETRPLADLGEAFRAAGFDVIYLSDGSAAEIRDGLQQVQDRAERDRIVVAATGHFARSRSDSWLLGVDTDTPSLARIGAEGVSLSTLLEIVSTAPGRAVVMLGLERRQMDLGRGLGAGVSRIEAPQGVTVLLGGSQALADFTTQSLLVPGSDLSAALASSQGLRSFGFVSPDVPFLDAPEASPPAPQTLPPATSQPDADERALWGAATELNTSGAYGAYIDRYPNGVFADEARARREALEADPAAVAEAAETALGLTRQQRQQIQRSLSILDFDTRGIDGIFGSGTRRAIAGWQTSNALASTGFLDAAQITALGNQAAVRTAELEAEARAARLAREAEDRAFWQAIGQGTTEDGLRRYLQRYPDGLFAEQAEARIAEIDAAVRAEAAARDRAAWDEARATDTVAAYTLYLQQWEEGGFAAQAAARIQELQGTGQGGFTQAQLVAFELEEQALNLPPVTRSLIEQRLQVLGLEPGRVDGRFDETTRRALRRYQSARGLDVTGYLNQGSVVRLLAETVGGILRIDGVIE